MAEPPVKETASPPLQRRRYLPFRVWGGWLVAILAAIITVVGGRQVVVVSNDNERLQDEITTQKAVNAKLREQVTMATQQLDTANARMSLLTRQLESYTGTAAITTPGKRTSSGVDSNVVPPEPSGSQPPTQYLQNFQITRPWCGWSDGVLTCGFRITNESVEPIRMALEIESHLTSGEILRTFVVDESGRRYYATQASLGGKSAAGGDLFVYQEFESTKPVSADVAFDVPEKPTAPLMVVLQFGWISGPTAIAFRDVRVHAVAP
jgi:hypothetical protein